MKHTNNYDTEINYHNKKPLNTKIYCNFYNDNFNFIKIENISLSQQTDITNAITETNTQTINCIGNKYLNNSTIATIIVDPTPSLNDNYLWIPEVSDNVVPGLDPWITYQNQKFASISTLHNSITHINTSTNKEVQHLQTEINNIEITRPATGGASKNLSYHTSLTDFMYQRSTTKNDNRR